MGEKINLISGAFIMKEVIPECKKHGEIAMLINAAGVSPSQAPIEPILKVDLYGTVVLRLRISTASFVQ